ncbi:MAG: polysaccharide deacetylase family protein [Phycisphaera sp.]|nr:polysaccharide deacetylase family protein [Phycisphaera sp.]
MVSVCMYFQVHQPMRLRRYSVFDIDTAYFDEENNSAILKKIAGKCYLPATGLLLDLVRQYEGRFRFAMSLSGIVLEQLREHAPRVITLLQELARTGCVEFLSETYHHSLAFLYSRDEFREQVELHRKLIAELFGQTPTVFRNTELIYNNDLASYVGTWGVYKGILAEGADHVLGKRTPNHPYHIPGTQGITLLLKNYRLSDDIAFRFSNRSWPEWPLTADKYARWVKRIDATTTAAPNGRTCNLFMDYETLGEHQWEETGIFEFLRALPKELMTLDGIDFKTPTQVIESCPASDVYDSPHMTSWADTERDLSAWLGNAMQSNALHELYKLEDPVKATKDADILRDWRRLTSSDHFYYMCTKFFADGDVHKYFNPYESPYDSYINFMNVLDNLRSRVEQAG